MSKNRIAVILVSVILIIAQIDQICFAFPSILDEVPEKQILTTETSAGIFTDDTVFRAFKLLNYLNIISEERKDFEEAAVVSRAYAVSAFAAMRAGSRASIAGESFSDVPIGHQYAAGIRQALEFGITDNSQSKFYPNKNASYEDVAVWALKTLNYDAFPNSKTPVAAAAEIGVFKGIGSREEPITMGKFLRMLENVLNTDLVNINISGGGFSYRTDRTRTYLSDKYNVYLQEGILTGCKYSSLYGDSELGADKVQINRENYEVDEELPVELVGYSVGAYVDDDSDKIITVWIKENKNNTYEVEKKDYDSFEESFIKYSDTKKININGSIRMMKNDIFDGYYGASVLSSLPATDKIIVIDNDGDGRGDLIKVYKYTHYFVKSVSQTSECFVFGNDLGTQDISNDVITEITFEGKAVDPFTEVKANDVLTALEGVVAGGKKVFRAEISRDAVDDTISMIGSDSGGQFYVLDGSTYYLSDNLIEYMKARSSFRRVGESIQAYLGSDKKIAYIKSEDDFSYGYLMGATYDDIDEEFTVTVYTVGGSKEKYAVKEKVKVYDQDAQDGRKVPTKTAYDKCLNPDGSLKDIVVGYTVDSSDDLSKIAFEVPKGLLSNSETYPLTLDLDYNPTGSEVSEARAYHGLFAGKWTFDGSIPVLIVPSDESFKKNEKAYSKTTGNKWGNGNGAYLKKGEMIKAYNSDDFLRPQFYTVKTSVTTVISQGGGSLHFCTIDKITDVYDEEEAGSMRAICYYAGTQYKTVKISEDVTIARAGVFCDVNSADDLKKGDIIQFHTDAVGNIDVLTVYFRISDPPSNGYGCYYYNSDTSSLVYTADVAMESLLVVYAKVKDVDSNKALLTTSGGMGFPVTIGGYSSYGEVFYVIYDKNKKTAEPAKLSDIKPGDTVVMRKYYNHVQDVVIIKD